MPETKTWMTNLSQQNQSVNPPSVNIGTDLTSTKTMAVVLEYGFTGLVWTFSILSATTLFWIGWIVFKDARPAVNKFGLEFFLSQQWNVPDDLYGALPYIYGTVVSSAVAILLAFPLGVAVAIVTSEDFLPIWVRSPISFMVELIASIPSVIVGLWGVFVLIPLMLPLQLWLNDNFSWIPLFKTEPFGASMLVAGVLLAVMILPTVAAISREVLLAVPRDLRSASRSLGATRWETIWRIMLPTAASGIVGAVILALGRALGETMAVTMVIGNSTQISASLLGAGYTIPAVLANEFAEAITDLHIGALMYLALILFAITLVVNIIAVLLVQLIGNEKMKS